jgi:D-alanyl-D-alanine dipeptidase
MRSPAGLLEPIVDAREALRFDVRRADPEGWYGQLRSGVVDRLLRAESLLPNGFQLLVIEGYRPLSVGQRGAPHETGGAVDLTLCSDNGVELDLGTAVNASPGEVGDRSCIGSRHIGAQARELRGVLGLVLTSTGLVNDPAEWWHWSYGDAGWAQRLGCDRALYGPVAGSIPGQRRWRAWR